MENQVSSTPAATQDQLERLLANSTHDSLLLSEAQRLPHTRDPLLNARVLQPSIDLRSPTDQNIHNFSLKIISTDKEILSVISSICSEDTNEFLQILSALQQNHNNDNWFCRIRSANLVA